jgi:transcriptional regulator with GAF, ATPase, and Fis domain
MEENFVAFFRKHNLTKGYTDNEINQFVSLLQEITYRAGEIILREDQKNDSLYFLYDGELEVMKYDEVSDNYYLINSMKTGAHFGEMSVITGESTSAMVKAKTDCIVLVLSHKNTLSHEVNAKLLLACSRNVSKRLQLISEKQARLLAEEARREREKLTREIQQRDQELTICSTELRNTKKHFTKLYLDQYEIDESRPFGDIIGTSPLMQNIFELIKSLSDTDTTVMITGESGTGKGMIAVAIHQMSKRCNEAFISVNCAALSDELLASELFGHKRGAFTGATEDRVGRFQMADGGTLFLDEIGDISPKQQAYLLRILETGEYERAGDSKTLRVDVRVIAATNRSLEQKVSEGTFREDLYYRLNVMNILAPPLRDRKEDIPLLSDHFRKHFNQQLNRNVEHFSKETKRLMANYGWPGNVRELRNTIERALLLCRETKLQKHHLPREFSVTTDVGYTHKPKQFKKEITPDTKPVLDAETVNSALDASYWNVTQAAKNLNISRVHLHRLIKKYKLTRD